MTVIELLHGISLHELCDHFWKHNIVKQSKQHGIKSRDINACSSFLELCKYYKCEKSDKARDGDLDPFIQYFRFSENR